MPFATRATGMQKPDVEPSGNLCGVIHRKIFSNGLRCKTLAVDSDLNRFDPLCARMTRLEYMDVVRIRQRAGHLVLRIVIACNQVNRYPAIAQLGHLLDEELTRRVVFPVPVENIARDEQKVDFGPDRKIYQVLQRSTRSGPQPFDGG